mgnify:FL=1
MLVLGLLVLSLSVVKIGVGGGEGGMVMNKGVELSSGSVVDLVDRERGGNSSSASVVLTSADTAVVADSVTGLVFITVEVEG